MRLSHVFLVVPLALVASFLSDPSYSQAPAQSPPSAQESIETAPTPPEQPQTAVAPDSQAQPFVPVPITERQDAEKSAEGIKGQFDKYVDPTYANLAQLYWALGILDVNRDKLIDHFIAITECEMYKSYINNDLEWREIREATKEHLRENYKKFPTTFRITIPLYLGAYNYEDEYFEVNEKESSIKSVRNIETIYYNKPVTCGFTGDVEGYPRNLILYLNRPFSLPQLPVEKELARLYLDDLNEQLSQKNLGNQDPNTPRKADAKDRMAFLELMFRVHSFKETKFTMGGMVKAVVFAQIEYVRVYADFDKEKLLYEKDMFVEDKRKRKKRAEGTAEEDINLPDGPIFEDATKKKK